MIDNEIINVEYGKVGWIMLKINNFVDKELVDYFYFVVRCGVKICIIVCGMCLLVFFVVNDNICIISIVDCFLEYFWVMVFYNNGDEKVYILLVDWMIWNLDYCVEVVIFIYDEKLK